MILGRTEEDDNNARTLVHDFCNYGPLAPALKGQITTVEIMTDKGHDAVPRLTFTGTSGATGQDLFLAGADREGAIAKAKEDRSKRAQCRLNIQGCWTQLGRPGQAPASDFKVAMRQFDRMTVSRARDDLGVEAVQERNADTGVIEGWVWRFPADMEGLS